MDKKIYLACDCHNVEHITRFSYLEEEPNEICMETHLVDHLNFWKRILKAIKYVFGFKFKYGYFDCTIISPENAVHLRDELNVFLKENDRYEKDK